VNSENGREQSRGEAAKATRRRQLGFTLGVSQLRGGSFRRVLRTQALRRGELPRTAAPVTGRLRSPPYPAAAPASTTARPSPSRRVRQSPGERHSKRGGTPRIIRAGPSSVKGTRRSFL